MKRVTLICLTLTVFTALAILQVSDAQPAPQPGLLLPPPGNCTIPTPQGNDVPLLNTCRGVNIMVTPNTDWDICLKKNATDKGYGICFSVKTGPQDPKNPTMVWATYTYRWHTASGFNARINGTAAGFSTLVLSLGPYQIGTPLVIEGRTVNPDGSIKLEPATDRYIGWAQKR